jgi:hypothetical protein
MVSPLLWGVMPSCSSAWPHTQPNSPFSHSSKTLVRLPHLSAHSYSQFRPTNRPLSTCVDIERLYGERKLLAERKPLPLSAAQCLQRTAGIQRNRSFSATSVSSAAISEETAIDLDGPFDRMSISTNMSISPSTGGMGNGAAGTDTPTRTAKITKHDLLNQYFRKDVVVWSNLDWFRCVRPVR